MTGRACWILALLLLACSKSAPNDGSAAVRQSAAAPTPRASMENARRQYTEPNTMRPEHEGDATFKLKFAWPKSLAARVVSTRRVTKNEYPEVAARMNWSFHASANEIGWRVDLRSAALTQLAGRFEEELLDGALVAVNVLPSFTIGRDGRFIGLIDFARSQDMLQSSVLNALPARVDRAKAKQLLDAVLEQRRTELSTSNNWQALVSSAIDLELATGNVYQNALEVPLPATGMPVAFEGKLRARGPMPCTVSSTQRRCVWIEMDATPNPKALSAAISRAASNALIPGMSDLAIAEARYRTEAVIEVETLIPHWYHLTQSTDFSFKHDGETMALHQVQERSDAFQYPVH